MLDFRYDTFLALCQIGSFTKTAEFLCITQPAVSQHIKFLEQKYGGKLFAFRGKKLILTERGQRLQEFTKTVSSDITHLKEQLLNRTEQVKHITFGATLSIGEFVMPKIMAAILAQSPGTRLNMQVHNTETLLRKLENGEIRFALLEGYFNKMAYDWRLFSQEDFIAVCSPRSLLADGEIKLDAIFGERLFLREKGSGTRNILEHILYDQGQTIDSFGQICEIGNMSAIKELVQDNLGITFLYRAVAEKDLAAGRLKQIKIQDFHVRRAFHFVYLKHSKHEPEYLEWFDAFRGTLKRQTTKDEITRTL